MVSANRQQLLPVARELTEVERLCGGRFACVQSVVRDVRSHSNAVEAEVYLPSGISSHPADLCLVLEQLPIVTPEAAARFGPTLSLA
jgi:hypothetical protein